MAHPGTSTCTTTWEGGAVAVLAEPFYLGEHSKPAEGEFVFGYRIEITNVGPHDGPACRLLWRRWTITDGTGIVREVQGSGVVGEQPLLHPGDSFEYRSFCPLPTPSGTMEGSFTFQGELDAGERLFEVRVAPFELRSGEQPAERGQ